MNNTNKKINMFVMMLALVSLSSCYDKFDPDSYKPPFTISGFAASDEIASDNLVGYWSFDGSFNETISGAEGTNVEATLISGFKGQAMQGKLNGYVLSEPSNAITAMTSFTVSFWVNSPPPSTGIIGLFSLSKTDSFWGNIEMFFENGSDNTNGKLRTHIFNGTADVTFASDNVQNLFDKWVHMAVTYDGATSTYVLYVNGSTVSTIVSAGTGNLAVTNPGNIVFGAVQFMTDPSQTSATGSQPWASYLTGAMDEVRVYNRALTAEEVNALVVLQGKGK